MENKRVYISFKITEKDILAIYQNSVLIQANELKFFVSKKSIKYFDSTKDLILSLNPEYEYTIAVKQDDLTEDSENEKISGVNLINEVKDIFKKVVKPKIDITQFK